jgi:glycosyltransferase involved in cell wall biosynthesis
MEESVQISVVLPVYNGEKYLSQAIDSILNQTFGKFEFIIINDGSSDSTLDIISKYNDNRIKIVNNIKNEGLIDSLNKGLSMSRGKYIARMDADDIALPERLQVQYDFMEANLEIGICGSWFETFNETDNRTKVVKFPATDIGIRALMICQSAFCHPTVMLRRDIIEKLRLGYAKEFYRAEDYRLWIELLNYTQGANIPQVLLRYRRHANNETHLADKDLDSKVAMISKIQYLYMRQKGIDLLEEECYTFTYFMDRSFYFDLSLKEQTKLEKILKKIFLQLSKTKGFDKKVRKNIYKTIVFRSIKQRQILYCLRKSFYRKMFMNGLMTYLIEL